MRPALAVPAKAPPKGNQWVHEAKWDGYRIQIVKDGTDVRLYSKNGAEWTRKVPAMVEAFRDLPARSAIIDGGLCYATASGRPDFEALMREMRTNRPDPFHLVVYAFDLLHLDREDLRPKPFSERRRKLAGLDKPLPCLFVVDQFNDGDDHIHRRRKLTPRRSPPLLRYAPQLRSPTRSKPSTRGVPIARRSGVKIPRRLTPNPSNGRHHASGAAISSSLQSRTNDQHRSDVPEMLTPQYRTFRVEPEQAYAAVTLNRWRTNICPSCFDQEAENAGIRYTLMGLDGQSWSDKPPPRNPYKRKR